MAKAPRTRAKPAAAVVREDGYSNMVTGLARAQDVAARGGYTPDMLLDQVTLESVFAGDGLGRRIVEMPAEEAIRQWLTIAGDEGQAVLDAMESLRVQSVLTDAYVWARLYGGAVILRLLDDGGALDTPLDRTRLRRVLGYRVYDRHKVTWTKGDLEQDEMSPRYGQPEFYTVHPSGMVPRRVHASRLCVLDGQRLPDDVRQRNNGWGASVLQGVWQYLIRVGQNYGYTANIMRDFVQAVLTVNGLSQMLGAGQEAQVQRRVELLDLSRSILNTMILDAENESYTKQASSVAGIADLLDRHAEALCAVTGIPMTKLFGRSPAGMNATGESDMRNFYDTLGADQKSYLSPVMEELIRDHYLAKEGPTRGGEPDAWSLRWNSLWQPTDKETAELRKIVAETDAIYVQNGVLSAAEVADSRFGQGEWQMETALAGTDQA
jgi:phage-related protein (TIGR01555 family)